MTSSSRPPNDIEKTLEAVVATARGDVVAIDDFASQILGVLRVGSWVVVSADSDPCRVWVANRALHPPGYGVIVPWRIGDVITFIRRWLVWWWRFEDSAWPPHVCMPFIANIGGERRIGARCDGVPMALGERGWTEVRPEPERYEVQPQTLVRYVGASGDAFWSENGAWSEWPELTTIQPDNAAQRTANAKKTPRQHGPRHVRRPGDFLVLCFEWDSKNEARPLEVAARAVAAAFEGSDVRVVVDSGGMYFRISRKGVRASMRLLADEEGKLAFLVVRALDRWRGWLPGARRYRTATHALETDCVSLIQAGIQRELGVQARAFPRDPG